jgi:hypothetical protein
VVSALSIRNEPIEKKRMANSTRSLTLKQRVVIAFVLVPWLPLLIFVPFEPAGGGYSLFGWDRIYSHLAQCLIIAVFTYFLELTILIPLWRSMQRRGQTSLRRVLVTAFVVALVLSIVVFSLITGADFLFESYLTWLIPLICAIACTEALCFWLIVRPDKVEHARSNFKSQTDV